MRNVVLQRLDGQVLLAGYSGLPRVPQVDEGSADRQVVIRAAALADGIPKRANVHTICHQLDSLAERSQVHQDRRGGRGGEQTPVGASKTNWAGELHSRLPVPKLSSPIRGLCALAGQSNKSKLRPLHGREVQLHGQ